MKKRVYNKFTYFGQNILDLSKDTATEDDVLEGKTFHDSSGEEKVGKVKHRTSEDIDIYKNNVSIPSGTYETTEISIPLGSASVTERIIELEPTINVSSTGYVEALQQVTNRISPNVTPGYIEEGKSGPITVHVQSNIQLDTISEQTITPTIENQTIPKQRFLTGNQTILGDSNLVAENIKKDVSIFGVTGELEPKVDAVVQSLVVTPSEEQQVFNSPYIVGQKITDKRFGANGTQNLTKALNNAETYFVRYRYVRDNPYNPGYLSDFIEFMLNDSEVIIDDNNHRELFRISTNSIRVTGFSSSYDSLSIEIYESTHFDGYFPVTVNAIDSTYVGSSITRRANEGVSIEDGVVTVLAGYYPNDVVIYPTK